MLVQVCLLRRIRRDIGDEVAVGIGAAGIQPEFAQRWRDGETCGGGNRPNAADVDIPWFTFLNRG